MPTAPGFRLITASLLTRKDQICDLSHTPCSALIGDKPLTVAIKDFPLRAEHDFAIAITGGDPAIKPVKATLEGKDMFMGTIPVSFEQIDGQWQGVTQVGDCTSPVMIWLLNIEWSNGQRQQLALSVPGNNGARGGEWKKYLKFPGQGDCLPQTIKGVKFI